MVILLHLAKIKEPKGILKQQYTIEYLFWKHSMKTIVS